jgi:hypothetical protein
MKKQQLQIRFTGKTGQVDGYVEILLGMFAMSQILVSHAITKKIRPNGITQIYADLVVLPPLLGHIGENDIPERMQEDE